MEGQQGQYIESQYNQLDSQTTRVSMSSQNSQFSLTLEQVLGICQCLHCTELPSSISSLLQQIIGPNVTSLVRNEKQLISKGKLVELLSIDLSIRLNAINKTLFSYSKQKLTPVNQFPYQKELIKQKDTILFAVILLNDYFSSITSSYRIVLKSEDAYFNVISFTLKPDYESLRKYQSFVEEVFPYSIKKIRKRTHKNCQKFPMDRSESTRCLQLGKEIEKYISDHQAKQKQAETDAKQVKEQNEAHVEKPNNLRRDTHSKQRKKSWGQRQKQNLQYFNQPYRIKIRSSSESDLDCKQDLSIDFDTSENKKQPKEQSQNSQVETKKQQVFEDLKQYPMLLADYQVFSMRSIFFNHLDSSQQVKNHAAMLTISPPPAYQDLFEEAKQLLVKILKNKKNELLSCYKKFATSYREALCKKTEETYEEDKIQQMLLRGVKGATLVMIPLNSMFGLTLAQKIYCNLSTPLIRLCEKQTKLQYFSPALMDLLKAVFCLTIIHELAHFLIRQLQIIGCQESSMRDRGFHVKPFSHSKENQPLRKFYKTISYDNLVFMAKHQGKLLQFGKLFDNQAISRSYQEAKKQILQHNLYLCFQEYLTLPNLDAVCAEMQEGREMAQNSQQQEQAKIEQKDFLKLAQMYLTRSSSPLSNKFEEVRLKKGQRAIYNFFKAQLENEESLMKALRKFHIQTLTPSLDTLQEQILKIKVLRTNQLFPKIFNEDENKKDYLWRKFQQLLEKMQESVKSTTTLIKRGSQLRLPIKCSNLQVNIQQIQLSLIISTYFCDWVTATVQLAENPFKHIRQLEAGWVFENFLFRNLNHKDNQGVICSQDFQALKKLSKVQTKSGSFELRSSIGTTSEIVTEGSYNYSMVVSRDADIKKRPLPLERKKDSCLVGLLSR